MTRVGLIVALPGEKRTLTNARIPSGRFLHLNDNTLICVSGVGPEKAAAAAALLVNAGCGALLSWGCAAAIAADLNPGDLIVPEVICGANGSVYHADLIWRNNLLDRLSDYQNVHAGAIAESLILVETAADKRALRDQTGALALDMESAAIAKQATRYNLPFVTIRAIADPAIMSLPRPVAVSIDQNGDVNLARLLFSIAREPGAIPGMIRLGFYFRKAQRRLQVTAHKLKYNFSTDTARV